MTVSEPIRPDDPAEDARRIAWAERKTQELLIAELKRAGIPPGHADAVVLRRLTHCDLDRIGAEEANLLKGLAWRWRRRLPAGLAPKLPPHDPLVKALEVRNGR